MCKHTAAAVGKSGQIRDTKPNNEINGRPGRTIICFSGHVVKNQDCPGKSRTDGHLIHVSITLRLKLFLP